MNIKRHRKLTMCLVIVFALMLLPTNTILADTTGQQSPTNMSFAWYGSASWMSPDNAKVSDNVYATVYANTSIQATAYLKAKGFGFAIPDGSTINGITVDVERAQTSAGAFYDEVAALVINDTVVLSSNMVTTPYQYWPTVDTVKTFGTPTSLWGQTLTPADINNPNFGFVMAARKITGSRYARIDYIGMTVYYTPPVIPDTTPPIIAAQNDITVEATSALGAMVDFSPTATDNIDPNVTVNCTPASGSQFPLGTTQVTCDATDAAGNPAIPVTFNVIVQDTTSPVITLNGSDPFGVNQDTVYTELGASWTDAVDGTGNANVGGDIVNTSLPGTSYIITYDYTDTNLNAAAQVTRTVNVLDTVPPVIASQNNMTVEATSDLGAIVNFTPSATDNLDASVTVICTPASGSYFPLGTTQVTCNATDAAGNAATPVTFDVTVQDTTAPVITLNGTDPYDIAYASTYDEPGATWNDAVDGTGSAIVGGDTVDTLVPGPYNITYNYTDAAGNVATQVRRTVNVLPWSTINVTKDVLSWKGKATVDPYVFTIQIDGTDNKLISETVTATYDRLPPGTYIITELPEAKYTLQQIIGDNDADATNGAAITVGSGQTVTLTFVNWIFQPNKK